MHGRDINTGRNACKWQECMQAAEVQGAEFK
jgi:hypothetical protein